MKHIVIASDSFKGSLSSEEVAESVRKGIERCMSGCRITCINVADGGEGTVEAMVSSLDGHVEETAVSDPLGRPIKARYGIAGDTAIIEMAAASGLPLLDTSERNPWKTSTKGTGELIMDACRKGCRKFLIGIGGSATNDAGTGMLEALGVKFKDADGRLITGCCGGILHKIMDIDMSGMNPEVKESSFIVACDVDTVFCGPDGAAAVFAPQKGADKEMTKALDEGMRHFADIIHSKLGKDISSLKGSGAAGGLGGAFSAFLGAELKSGIEMVLDAIGFDSIIKGADLVITGEGKMDSQTPKGKTATGVLGRTSRYGIRTMAICGKLEMCKELSDMAFDKIIQATPEGMPLDEAMKKDIAAKNVEEAAVRLLQ